MWSSEIELGNLVETVVNYEVVKSIAWVTVYANKLSVRQSEHYNGVAVGRKPELVYEVRSFEFSNYEKARVNGKIYDIIRSYAPPKTPDITELVLSAPLGGEV